MVSLKTGKCDWERMMMNQWMEGIFPSSSHRFPIIFKYQSHRLVPLHPLA
jgi:hypothetical protein